SVLRAGHRSPGPQPGGMGRDQPARDLHHRRRRHGAVQVRRPLGGDGLRDPLRARAGRGAEVRALPLLLALAATAAGAEDRYPDSAFFTGVYERVGRDAQSPPGLIDDLLRIDPAAEGWGLRVSRCIAVDEPGWPLDLRHSGYDEVPNILEGRDGPFGLW